MFCRVWRLVAATLAVSFVLPALAAAPAAGGSPSAGPATDDHGFVVTRTTVGLDDTGRGAADLTGAPSLLVLEDLPVGAHLALRTRNDGAWSAWTELEATADEAPDGPRATGAIAVGPVWVGHDADRIEIDLHEGDVDRIEIEGLEPVEDAAGDSATSGTARAGAAPEFIHPRSDWATADMGWACTKPPVEADEVNALVVHHTAGANGYAAEDVPSIIRAIWRYHVQTRGWCDVAYNFLVDAYGGIWEGRQGGVDKAIVGGHTYGFNTGTIGVAQLGNLDTDEPTPELTDATRELISWKLGIHGIDPAGETTVVNRTGEDFRGTADDDDVPVATVIGHRDLGSTACPGEHTYDQLPVLRAGSREGVHVVALHELFLREAPTPAQFRRWDEVAEDEDLRAVAMGMAESEAYSGLIVEDFYQRVLNRSGDDDREGFDYWLGVLASGVSVEKVGVLFYGSEEYFLRKGGAEGFVTALYRNLLHREPETDGLTYWLDRMEAGMAPPQVATGFYRSIESRRDRVARLYDDILGREPDASGHAYWAEALLDDSDVVLAVDLSLSDEFYLRATT